MPSHSPVTISVPITQSTPTEKETSPMLDAFAPQSDSNDDFNSPNSAIIQFPHSASSASTGYNAEPSAYVYREKAAVNDDAIARLQRDLLQIQQTVHNQRFQIQALQTSLQAVEQDNQSLRATGKAALSSAREAIAQNSLLQEERLANRQTMIELRSTIRVLQDAARESTLRINAVEHTQQDQWIEAARREKAKEAQYKDLLKSMVEKTVVGTFERAYSLWSRTGKPMPATAGQSSTYQVPNRY